MTPANYNLPDAYRGDSYGPVSLKIKDQAGNYIDFTNVLRIESHIKNKKNYTTVLCWSTTDGTISIQGESIVLTEVPGNKMKMPAGVYDYDLQVIDAYSIRTYLKGVFLVEGDVTDIVVSS